MFRIQLSYELHGYFVDLKSESFPDVIEEGVHALWETEESVHIEN